MCYDKKLEASRDDFLFPLDSNGETRNDAENPMVAEVDSVLTSGEVLELLQVFVVAISVSESNVSSTSFPFTWDLTSIVIIIVITILDGEEVGSV